MMMKWCRTSEELMLYLGCKIGYWRGDIKGLVDDIGGHSKVPVHSNKQAQSADR